VGTEAGLLLGTVIIASVGGGTLAGVAEWAPGGTTGFWP